MFSSRNVFGSYVCCHIKGTAQASCGVEQRLTDASRTLCTRSENEMDYFVAFLVLAFESFFFSIHYFESTSPTMSPSLSPFWQHQKRFPINELSIMKFRETPLHFARVYQKYCGCWTLLNAVDFNKQCVILFVFILREPHW